MSRVRFIRNDFSKLLYIELSLPHVKPFGARLPIKCTSELGLKVVRRAGKAKGKNRNYFNLEYTSPSDVQGKQCGIDLEHVDDLSVIEPSAIQEPVDTDQVLETSHLTFETSRAKELDSWIHNHVYTTM